MHKKIHRDVSKHEFDECNKKFTNKQNMMRHKKEAHYERNINVQFVEDMDDMKYIVECKECELKVKRKADLKRHEVGRHSSSRSYQCSSCDETFPRNDGLTRHMKSTHLNEKNKL
jgi:uncharacterized Zn-finger protein